MEVNRLLGDELVYELQIRGLPIQRLVAENRSTLRGALRMERDGISSVIYVDRLNPEEEYRVCKEKLTILQQDLLHFDKLNYLNEYKRIHTRLLHVNLRLRRVPEGTEEQEEIRSTLLGCCLRLIDAIGEINESVHGANDRVSEVNLLAQDDVMNHSILDDPIPLLPDTLLRDFTSQVRVQPTEDVEVSEAAHNLISFAQGSGVHQEFLGTRKEPGVSTDWKAKVGNEMFNRTDLGFRTVNSQASLKIGSVPVGENRFRDLDTSGHSRNYGIQESQTRFCDISRWKVQFDGDSSVTSFIERIEELRLSRNVTEEQLLRSAVELFTKDALLWYRTHKFHSWGELMSKLRQDFQPYDYELDLWEEIRKRTQGVKERVITYIAAVENLFNRLGENKPSERTRVDWIRRGLLPHIQSQLALHPVETISELTRLGRLVEETFVRTQRFCPPPTNYRNLLEPDLAYRKSSNNQYYPSCSAISPDITVKSTDSVRMESDSVESARNYPVCWNCGKRGHRFKKCSEPKKIFCFRCGTLNVVASNCPKCSKNGKGCSK